ncbi:MAG: FecR domain-containing protein [Pyrinomonadaceae bacterium]
MKKIFPNIFAIGAIVFLSSIYVFAQKGKTVSNLSQYYVISAKAGGVNYVEGTVTILRKAGKSGYLLKNDKLEIGDKVSTGNGGKAEILLNPGSYIRLAENSEFEFITTSLDDLKLKLTRGSAMLEVFADADFRVVINTPGAQFYVVKSGVYRVDAPSGAEAKIEVWEGRAQTGDANATVIKEGREATISGSQITVAKFDRDEKDALEAWSRTRAKELAKINARLEKTALRDTLIASYGSNSWNVYDSFGLWIYDASFSGFCFLPFGYGWYSPYGYNYGWNMWRIKVPSYIYNPPVNPTISGSGSSNGNGTSNDRTVGNVPTRIPPPYQQIQDNGGVQIRKNNPMLVDDISPFPSGAPTSMPSQPVRVVTPQTKNPKAVDTIN